jgi:hypothetical protein
MPESLPEKIDDRLRVVALEQAPVVEPSEE